MKKRIFSKFINRRSILITWIISYIIILLIPLATSIGVYFLSKNVIKEIASETQIGMLNNIKTMIDKELEGISQIGINLAFNTRITNLASTLLLSNNNDTVSEYIEIQKILGYYQLSNNMISNIYIYFDKLKFLLSSTNKYYMEDFDFILKNDLGIDRNDFIRLITSQFWSGYHLIRAKGKNPKFVYIQSIPTKDLRNTMGTIIILLNSETIEKTISDSINTNKYIVNIINKDDKIFSVGNEDILKNLDINTINSDINNKEKIFFINDNKRNSLCIVHLPSQIEEFHYYIAFSLKLLLLKVNYIKVVNISYFIFCFLIGLLISIYLAQRNYSPLKRIIEMLLKRIKLQDKSNENEFSFIENIFENIMETNVKLSKKVEEQNKKLIDNLLVRILKEENTNNKIIKFTKDIEGFEKSSKYLIVGININEISEQFFMIEKNEEEIELAYFVVKNVLQELINSRFKGYVIEIDGKIISIIYDIENNMENEKIYTEIKYLLNQMIDFLNDKFGISITAAISCVYSAVDSIPKAYKEIVEIFSYSEIDDESKNILLYENILTKLEPYDKEDTFSLLKRIIECMSIDDFTNLLLTINTLLNTIKDLKHINHKIAKYQLNTLTNIITNYMLECNLKSEGQLFGEDDFELIQKTHDIEKLKESFNIIIKRIKNYFELKEEERKPYWLKDVCSIVENNLQKTDLSVETIAKELDLSVAHLSRAFKKYMGINLSDYIHRIRLNKVQKLLLKTHLSIKEIAEKTGYIDSKALIRVFKKYIGTTPTKYREENRIV